MNFTLLDVGNAQSLYLFSSQNASQGLRFECLKVYKYQNNTIVKFLLYKGFYTFVYVNYNHIEIFILIFLKIYYEYI